MPRRNELPQWQALEAHATELGATSVSALFARDPARHEHLSFEALDLLYDCSRQRATPQTLELLVALARACDLEQRIAALFAGEPVNHTERRAALHVALRNRSDRAIAVDGHDVMPAVRAELAKMREFVTAVHEARITGAKGARFTDVVNIGIGGSDLGIVMATEALRRFRIVRSACTCVSNVDGCRAGGRARAARSRDARCSWSARRPSRRRRRSRTRTPRASGWSTNCGEARSRPRSSSRSRRTTPRIDAFGIAPDARYAMWDWVGGRYSLWSAVGLSIALAVGMDVFEAAARRRRTHGRAFPQRAARAATCRCCWACSASGTEFSRPPTPAVLPYDAAAGAASRPTCSSSRWRANGKCVTRDGEPVRCATGRVIWGEPGTNAQHSFFQLLHQGNARVALDFIAPVNGSSIFARQHAARARELHRAGRGLRIRPGCREVRAELEARGTAATEIERLVPHKLHAGSRPTSLIMFPRLGPRTLGRLIACTSTRSTCRA